MLNTVLLNMRVNGCIVACGMISQYNLEKPDGVYNLSSLIANRVHIQGFIVSNYYHFYPKFIESTLEYISKKEISFTGHNVGKQVVVGAME
ncbi:hypothetical protein GIB67_032842 [Kingdonia uniflora]|uniref:Uncharacterized protein n=1 Tax=Kingdonia uniflora TaxID=39325 RepID=A0A7J7NC39_9MAGN|nr:hypothetical protein GIB67_032842 [Kingdonia uniflora]